MRRITALFVLLLAFTVASWAQTYDQLIESNVPEDPFAWLTYRYDTEANINTEDPATPNASVTEYETELYATFPLLIKEPILLFGGAQFAYRNFMFSDVDMPDLHVYTLALPVGFIYAPESPWEFVAAITPGLFSDLKEIDNDDFRIYGLALGMYSVGPQFQIGAGVAHDQIFGADRFFPMGGVIWTPNNQWKVEMILPMPRVFFSPNKKLNTFLQAQPAGGNWSVYEDDREYNFTLQSLRINGGAEYNFAGRFWIHAALGVNTDRNYEIRQGNERVIDSDVDDAIYGKIGLLVR